MPTPAMPKATPTATPAAASPSYALEVLDVSKQFPGVKALDRISLRLRPGAVHALMGENGAGKSTLMKIIAGSIRSIRQHRDRRPACIRNPRGAIGHGMAFLTEDRKASGLFMMFSVLENMQIASMGNFSPRASCGRTPCRRRPKSTG